MTMTEFWKVARRPLMMTSACRVQINDRKEGKSSYQVESILIYFWGEWERTVQINSLHLQKIKDYKLPEKYALWDRRVLLNDIFEDTMTAADIAILYRGNVYDN